MRGIRTKRMETVGGVHCSIATPHSGDGGSLTPPGSYPPSSGVCAHSLPHNGSSTSAGKGFRDAALRLQGEESVVGVQCNIATPHSGGGGELTPPAITRPLVVFMPTRCPTTLAALRLRRVFATQHFGRMDWRPLVVFTAVLPPLIVATAVV